MVVHLAPAQGFLRALRGTALAITSASLSVAAHTAAGGSVPDPGTTILIIALLAAVGTALADRRRRPLPVIAALGVSQCLTHVLLELLGTHHLDGQPQLSDPTTMLLGHIAAALLTGLLLAHAEDALFALARVLGLVLPRKRTPLPIDIPPRPVVLVSAPLRVLAQLIHQRIHALRGPPGVSTHTA